MTSIEEALRSGAVRLVPVEVTHLLESYVVPPGLYDHASAPARGANSLAVKALDLISTSPDHTPALLALIEERDRLKVESARRLVCMDKRADRIIELTDRALAAEAKCDALREALAEIIKADTHLAWTGGAVPEPSHEEFGACAEIAARALTQETADVGE